MKTKEYIQDLHSDKNDKEILEHYKIDSYDELSLRNSEDNKHMLIEKRINNNTKEIVDEVETND